MPLARRVLNQEHFPGTDHTPLAVARRDFHGALQIDDVLAPWRGMPVEVVVAGSLAKDDARGWQPCRILAEIPLLGPCHIDVTEVGFSLGIGIEIVNAHRSRPPVRVETV